MSQPEKTTFYKYNIIKIAAVIFLISFFVHIPSLFHGFINFDDYKYIKFNSSFVADWTEFTQWAFYTKYFSNYHPLTWLSYKLDYSIWGLNPFGYHLTNIIFHSMNAILVFIVIKELINVNCRESKNAVDEKRTFIISAMVTALFITHPIHIESVTWISERKDVLYSFFYLISIHFYCNYLKAPKINGKFYIFSLLFFLFSLFSKAMAVTLPATLLILDIFIYKRYTKQSTEHSFRTLIIEKIPFLLFSIIFSLIAIKAQNITDSLISIESFTYTERIISYIFTMPLYVIKLIIPTGYTHLHPIIPYEQYIAFSSLFFIFMSALFLLTTAFTIVKAKKGNLVPVAIYTFFLITILPTSTLFLLGTRIIAERYLYLASIAIFLAFSLLLYNHIFIKYKKISLIILITIFSTLTFLNIKQQLFWQSTLTLWNNQIEIYGHIDTTGYYYRGVEYKNAGLYTVAIADFNSMLGLKTNHANAYRGRGYCYTKQGKHKEAINDYKKVVDMLPDKSKSYFDLGITYYKAKDYKNAKTSLTIAKDMGDSVAAEFLTLMEAIPNKDINQTTY